MRDYATNRGWPCLYTLSRAAHRDLKPENGMIPFRWKRPMFVLLAGDGMTWKIADFGLATTCTSQRRKTPVAPLVTAHRDYLAKPAVSSRILISGRSGAFSLNS